MSAGLHNLAWTGWWRRGAVSGPLAFQASPAPPLASQQIDPRRSCFLLPPIHSASAVAAALPAQLANLGAPPFLDALQYSVNATDDGAVYSTGACVNGAFK